MADPRRYSRDSVHSQPSFDPSVHSMSSIDPSDTEFDPSSDEDDYRSSISMRDSPDGYHSFSPQSRYSTRIEIPSSSDQKSLMEKLRRTEELVRDRDRQIEVLTKQMASIESDLQGSEK